MNNNKPVYQRAARIMQAAENDVARYESTRERPTFELSNRLQEIHLHCNGYAEPGYDDKECVATGNWNALGNKTMSERMRQLPERLAKLFERIGVECEWSDEWSTCDECGKFVRTSPDSHSWSPSYVVATDADSYVVAADAELLCLECAGEPTFDRWDVCLAYWHAAHGWNGTKQATKIRLRLEKLGYKPSPREEYSENISANAALILRKISERAREERW